MDWLVNVFIYPGPDRRPATAVDLGRQERLMATYSKYVAPTSWGCGGDFEDFFEQAYRLDAALQGFGPECVWVHSPGWACARNAATGERRPVDDLQHLPIYGAQPGPAGHFKASTADERLADRYPYHRAFLANAGRAFRIAGYATKANTAYDVLQELAAAGVSRFFVKVNPSKTGMFAFDLPPNPTREDMDREFMGDAVWAVMHLEGRKDALFIQERVTMEYEYRLFVIDGQVVTGAGCIEEYTPLNNQGEPFDPRVRRDRPALSPVESRRSVVSDLVAFGRGVAAQLAAEVPQMGAYGLDVALDGQGRPLVIELNGLLNSGLYASRPELITKALSGAPWASMRLPGHPPRGSVE